MSRIPSLILIFMLLVFMFFIPVNDPHYKDRSQITLKNGNHIKIKGSTFKTMAIRSEFLGYFVRGEDFCRINFTLIDVETGEPIPNALIEVYLNSSAGDFYLGSNYTNQNGEFEYVFLVRSYFPLGEVNITAIFRGDPIKGYGGAKAYYWAIFYGRVFISIRTDNQRKPLFDKNISITVWSYLDNGELYTQPKLNYTLKIFHRESSTLFLYSLQGDSQGMASLTFDFTLTGKGNYTIIAQLNGTNNSLQPYLLFSNQILYNNGTISGDNSSEAITDFEVTLASKIEASFQSINPKTYTFNAYLNETVVIYGIYYNVTGKPDSTTILMILLQNGVPIRTLSTVSGSDGYFYFSFTPISLNLETGEFSIIFRDNSTLTEDLSPTLKLYLYTILAINVTYISDNDLLMVGDNITIEGYVYDVITGQTVQNMSLNLVLSGDTFSYPLANTVSGSGGHFNFTNVTIPLTATGPYAILRITMNPLYPYYDTKIWSNTIELFTTLNVTLEVNQSRFTWLITRTSVISSTGDTLKLPRAGNLSIRIFNLRDEFDRIVYLPIEIYKDNELVYSGIITTETEFLVEVNDTSTLIIKINSLPLVSLDIIIGGTPPRVPPSIPILAIIIFPVIIIGILIYRFGSKLLIFRSFKVETESIEELVNDISILIENKRYREAADKIIWLLRRIGETLKLNLKDSLTAREILDQIYPRIEKDLYQILSKLVLVYELIRYGHKEPDKHIVESIVRDLPLLKHVTESVYMGELE